MPTLAFAPPVVPFPHTEFAPIGLIRASLPPNPLLTRICFSCFIENSPLNLIQFRFNPAQPLNPYSSPNENTVIRAIRAICVICAPIGVDLILTRKQILPMITYRTKLTRQIALHNPPIL
jgi:hypothetical protein